MPVEITMPPVPSIGLSAGVKATGQRVDFKPDKFETLIETKGYLLAWMRASPCPCSPIATETKQPDPTCSLCNGDVWYYFGGNINQVLEDIGDFTALQKKIINDNSAMVIRGVLGGIEVKDDPWDKMGHWRSGVMNLTVRHENRLAHYDKIVCLDSDVVYTEIVLATGGYTTPSKYLMTGVNEIRSVSTVYEADVHFKIVEGILTWFSTITPPTINTRLSLHYLCHPTFLIMDHPHAIRTTSVKYKTSTPATKLGDPRKLPVQAVVKLEFVPSD